MLCFPDATPRPGGAGSPLQGDRGLSLGQNLPAQVPYRNWDVTAGKWAKKKGKNTWGWATSFLSTWRQRKWGLKPNEGGAMFYLKGPLTQPPALVDYTTRLGYEPSISRHSGSL